MDTENLEHEAGSRAHDEPFVAVPPVHNRFLFVDIAALRAKQLRRGASPRLEGPGERQGRSADVPHKAERVAMEEVRRGLVQYTAPRKLTAAERE
jgi:DNA-directed RNA polymerase subunit K/omega